MSMRIFAFRCCVDGVTRTEAVRLLGMSENAVSRCYNTVLDIMCWDVSRRQALMDFGKHPKYSTDVEMDETSFKQWRIRADDPDPIAVGSPATVPTK